MGGVNCNSPFNGKAALLVFYGFLFIALNSNLSAQSIAGFFKFNGQNIPLDGNTGISALLLKPSCADLNEFCFEIFSDDEFCEDEFSMDLIIRYNPTDYEFIDLNGFEPFSLSPNPNSQSAIKLTVTSSNFDCGTEEANKYCVTFKPKRRITGSVVPGYIATINVSGDNPETLNFGLNELFAVSPDLVRIVQADGTNTPVKLSDIIDPTASDTDKLIPTSLLDPGDAQVLNVEGDLEIDVNYNFNSNLVTSTFSGINLGPNAKIIIKSGRELGLYSTPVSGCRYMWDRIEVESGARLWVADGLIQDGLAAIVANEMLASSTRIVLQGTEFINNLTGIYTTPLSGSSFHTPGLLFFNRLTFRGTGNPLKPTLVNNVEVAGLAYPYIAMDLSNINSLSITGNGNLVENMANGFRFSNSYINVNNITIENMIQDGVHRNEGIGINTMGYMSSLVMVPSGSVLNNMRIGIRSSEGNLDVKDVTITNVRDGIYSVAAFNKKFNIENCNINATNTGISQITGKPLSGAIANNVINIENSSETGFAGIRMATTGSEDFAVGPHNVITLENAPNGILLSNSRLLNVHDNEILNTNNAMQQFKGIAVNGGMGNIINCNALSTTDDPGFSNGIFLNGSGSTEITCNTPNGFLKGIGVYATNARSQLRGNTLPLSNETGLYYSANASTGLQYIGTDYFGNTWPGAAGPNEYEAYHEGYQLDIVDESRFQVDNKGGTQTQFLPNWDTNSTSTDWFRNRSGDNFVCPACTTSQLNWWDLVSDYDERIADTTWYTYDFSTEQHDLARRQLLWHLDQYGVPSGTATFYGDFQTDMNSEQVGEFYTWEHAWESGLNWSGTAKTQYLSKLYSFDSLNQLIHLYDSLNPSDSILSITRLDYLDQMKTLLDDQILADSAAQAQLLSHIAGSLFTMPSASSYVPGEADMVAYYTLFLMLQGDTLNTSDSTDLAWAAQLCPLEGGNAVFLARELYAYFVDDSVIYDDSTACIPPSPKAEYYNDHEIIAVHSLEVWPNPINEGNILFIENKNDAPSGMYHLIDLHGRIVDLQPMQPQLQWQIKVPSGIYILRATYEDGKTETHKIRIIK